MLLASTLCLAAEGNVRDAKDDRQNKVLMRMIGHQMLLNSGDSTSRVLPIEKVEDRYRIAFESGFQFKPDELVETIECVLMDTKIASNYLVEVENCASCEIVYSYLVGNSLSADVIPCGPRMQPKACYRLLFTILDTSAPGRASLQVATAYPPKNIPYFSLGAGIFVLLLFFSLGHFFWPGKRNAKPNPNIIAIGDYQFDKKNMKLSLDQDSIELTSKEADLLALLRSSANTTLAREVIMKTVWGDEGDYMGRTLDVFISKLRKKLEADPSVKIANIRGVGYKLVLNDPA